MHSRLSLEERKFTAQTSTLITLFVCQHMSPCLWVFLQRQGNHKTVKCFSSFLWTHFSFGGAFVAHGAGSGVSGRRRLMERATWTNPVWNSAVRTTRPSQIYDPPPYFPTQRPLSGAPGCIGPCLLFVTSLQLTFLSFSGFTLPLLFFMSIHLFRLSFLYLGISFSISPPPSLPDILTSCSSRQGVNSCLCKTELQL